MDFSVTDDLAEHRVAAREWVRVNVDPEWAVRQHVTGIHHNRELHERMARDGLLGAGWPPELGGTDVDPGLSRAIFDEIHDMGISQHGWSLSRMALETIRHVGTEEQRHTIIPAALRGDVLIALGYSEPDAGSDVAAAKTRAVRRGDEWAINGAKMFTSEARECSHVFLLTRTNPEVPKHEGLTMFLVPTDSPGFTLQPVDTLGGQRTYATFYSDVTVPDALRVGAVDGGWAVMRVALVYERAGSGRGTATVTVADKAASWAKHAVDDDGVPLYDDPVNRERLARIALETEVARLLSTRVRWVSENGGLPAVEGSMAKMFSSEAARRHHADLLDMLGSSGVLQRAAPGAPLDGELETAFRAAVVGTIYGGSSEIQREIIAERRLGLPRTRPPLPEVGGGGPLAQSPRSKPST